MMGGDFDHRWTQTRESVFAMKELWTSDQSEYHGKYYDFPPVYSFPSPVQRPHPPIHLGGNSTKVLQRVAKWGDGWMPYVITVEEVKEARDTLHRLAISSERDPDSIEITLFAGPDDSDLVKRYQDIGVDRVLIGIAPIIEQDTLEQMQYITENIVKPTQDPVL